MDKLYGHTGRRSKQQNNVLPTTIHPPKTEYENAKIGFWIDELLVLSPIGKVRNNSISPEKVADVLNELQEISQHLSDIDPMKMVLNTIVKAYK